MKNKVIGILLTVLVFALPVGITIFKPTPNSEKVVYTNVFTPANDTGISGPNAAVVGELVRLQIKGEQVKWQCLPKMEDIETFGESNDKCVISFRSNGEYTIIAAVLKDKVVTLETIKINVGGVSPGPGPINPTPMTKIDTGLAAQVRAWAVDSRVDKQLAKKLAANFNQVAQEAQAGSLTTTGELINRTATLNQTLNLQGFDSLMAHIQAELTSRADSGALQSVEQHIVIWNSIASGLEQYGADTSGSKR